MTVLQVLSWFSHSEQKSSRNIIWDIIGHQSHHKGKNNYQLLRSSVMLLWVELQFKFQILIYCPLS